MKNNFWLGSLLLLLLAGCSTQQEEEKYVQHVSFPENMSLEGKVDMASRLVPTEQQLAWQEQELTAFVHFGINTFTDREWGDGNEDPALFNPTDLDTDQWCEALSEAGFKMVILTAKHHDGFCLWPTKTTEHSVASSPWRDGKGDVVGDLAKSCQKYGLRLGLYLSPWDRNHPTYGEGDAYNKVYLEQLRELLTNYGEVWEVWFDGANGEGPNGKVQEYDWESVISLIKELQPNAITAIMGRDVRWVGNERGLGRETEWSATVVPPASLPNANKIKEELGISETSEDLGSREMLAKASELFWYPSEVDVSIRPGWFYHESEAPKSLSHLADIYFQSVGMNSSLLLNIPPNRQGLFAVADVERIRELGQFVREFNKQDAVKNFKPFTLEAGSYKEFELSDEEMISAIVLQEEIAKGQRVEHFEVEAFVGTEWQKVAEGTTIGYKRILLLEQPVRATKLRLKLLESRGTANISHLSARLVPEVQEIATAPDVVMIDKAAWKEVAGAKVLTIDLNEPVSLHGFRYTPPTAGAKIVTHYTLEGSLDGKEWFALSRGEFGNIINNPIPQYQRFAQPTQVKQLRFSGHNASGEEVKVECNQLDLF